MITVDITESNNPKTIKIFKEYMDKEYKQLTATLIMMGFETKTVTSFNTSYLINDANKVQITMKPFSHHATILDVKFQNAIPESVLKSDLIQHLNENYLT